MALSVNSPIDANDILMVSVLAQGHPVYLLRGPNLSRLVIKQETVSFNGGRKEALRTNVNLMHAVDTNARVVVLSGAEVQEITNYVQHEAYVCNLIGTTLDPDLQDLSNALAANGKWVKMGVKQLANLESAGNARINNNNPDKTGVRQFAAALNAAGGLEKLGEILAVDLFNDNQDRFCVQGQGPAFNGNNLQFMVNVGNVLLSSGRPSGLDSWDPTGPTRRTRQQLANADPNTEWGGYLLGPAASVTINGNVITRDAFARGVIADLEVVLGPRDRKLPILRKKRLEKHAETRLKQGMTSGATKIRTHLRTLAGAGGVAALPAMVQDKVNALGWVPL